MKLQLLITVCGLMIISVCGCSAKDYQQRPNKTLNINYFENNTLEHTQNINCCSIVGYSRNTVQKLNIQCDYLTIIHPISKYNSTTEIVNDGLKI